MARRLVYYAGASTAAAAACLIKAFYQRPNFYSATVYLSHSNACILILTNLVLVTACWALYGLQRLLYGPLRPIEVEQLSEKAWYAVLDTLLAMPSFREDVGGWLLTMFALLLAGKVWGWIADGRVDILEQQPPADPRWFHARLATSVLLSVGFALGMFRYCCVSVVRDPRPGMMVIFTFEFAILSVFALFTLARYTLCLVDARIVAQQTKMAVEARKQEIREERAATRRAQQEQAQNDAADEHEAVGGAAEQSTTIQTDAADEEEPIEVDEIEVDVPGWEEKRRYLFGLELFTDFLKLVIYLLFFGISVTFNGLPMHIMRDVYMTFISFTRRVADYIAYRNATSDMNARYPDATEEEIRGDVCIICREGMLAWEQPADAAAANGAAGTPPAAARRRDEGLRAKKLPCGHILHLRCLKAWLERQQVCPTCRRPVVAVSATATTNPAPGQNAPAAAGNNNVEAANAQNQFPHPQQPAVPQAPPQQQRQPRARLFNLGPIRIGFLNGPQEQVQNFINQFQNGGNPPAAANRNLQQDEAAVGAAAMAAAAGGPTQHLPTTGNPQQGPAGGNETLLHPANIPFQRSPYGSQYPMRANPASSMQQPSVQIQLMQIEQRLLHDAQNLALEQQQLGQLRAMEAELARLRAQHTSYPPPVGMTPRAVLVPQQTYPTGYSRTSPMFAPSFAAHTDLPPDVLRALEVASLPSGHDALPEGLVLPEGWTLTPLHRIDDIASASLVSEGESATPGNVQPTPSLATNGISSADVPALQQSSSSSQRQESVPSISSPASPPILATTNAATPVTIPPFPAPSDGQDSTSVKPSTPASTAPPPTKTSDNSAAAAVKPPDAPWREANSAWSFAPAAAGVEESESDEESTDSDDAPPTQEISYEGKGKGRAVEVEEVQDRDA